jgi:hypothetical protein
MSRAFSLSAVIERLFPSLRYPWLFLILFVLFLVDLVSPDPIPFVDEALLGLLTLLVGSWKTRKESAEPAQTPPPKDVTNRGSDSKE